jgi:hypothetical protein
MTGAPLVPMRGGGGGGAGGVPAGGSAPGGVAAPGSGLDMLSHAAHMHA